MRRVLEEASRHSETKGLLVFIRKVAFNGRGKDGDWPAGSCGALTENESEILTAAVEGGPESL